MGMVVTYSYMGLVSSKVSCRRRIRPGRTRTLFLYQVPEVPIADDYSGYSFISFLWDKARTFKLLRAWRSPGRVETDIQSNEGDAVYSGQRRWIGAV